MTRRSLLAAVAAAFAAPPDPERLLWTPGRKLISIPPRRLDAKNWTFNVETDHIIQHRLSFNYFTVKPVYRCWIVG